MKCEPLQVKRVLLLFKTHLDVGYTDFACNVRRKYFREFIPKAVALAQGLRSRGEAEKFVWTTGSWILYEYLEQASARERRELEDSIRAGEIAWHALPFTMHCELMDDSLFRFGLGLSQELDRRYGRRTIAAKMTDVPSHTRAIVPLLAEAGVRFLHIGVNPACTPPDVPDLFRWRAPGGEEIVVQYDKGTYGATTVFPGSRLAVSFSHSADNQGPPTLAQVLDAHGRLSAKFPSARIEASSLNDAALALLPGAGGLPVVTQELGDTWIHGVGTDPAKVAGFRALSRLRRRWLDSKLPPPEAARVAAFSRALLCIPEHTWGLDLKTTLKDFRHYSRSGLARLRRSAACRRLEASWREQRQYLHQAVRALGEGPLAREANAALRSLEPRVPSSAGMTPLQRPEKLLDAGWCRVAFSPVTGAITRLVVSGADREWASAAHPLGEVRYEIFGQADYDRFFRQYVRLTDDTRWWAPLDLGKPGLPRGLRHAVWSPQRARFWTSEEAGYRRVLAEMDMPQGPVRRLGCPRRFTCEYLFSASNRKVEICLQWFDKAACRMPEAIWFSVAPRTADPRKTAAFFENLMPAGIGGWLMDKMGQWISPLDVARNGNRRLHAVQNGLGYWSPDAALAIRTLDAPLVAPGAPSLLDFHSRQPALRRGWHFNLYNNVWGTNFPMWYEQDALFRFALSLAGEVTNADC